MWGQIINTLIGIWLMVAPGVLGHHEPGVDSNHIVGPVIATAAMVACWEVTRATRKVNILLGLWLIAAPFVLGYETPLPIINDIACGVLAVSFAMVKGKIKESYAGGWKALWQTGR